MTLKEKVFEEVYQYVINRKETQKQEVVKYAEGTRDHDILCAQIVEMMLLESLFLKRFAEYNTKLMQEIKKSSGPNELPGGS